MPPGGKNPRAWGAAVVALVAFAATARAGSDDADVALKRMKFAERSGNLVVTASFSELFDKGATDALASGLPTTVVVRIYVYRKAEELPISLVLANFKLVYDLWDEVYTVRIDGPIGKVNQRYHKRAEALKAATSFDSLPICDLSRIDIGPHYFMAMVAELNPVSPELLAEVRRWLARPAGEKALDSSSSFFGSFVSVFSNPKLPEADAVLRVQSQPFYRVPR
jgi:hypothetical protein